MKPISRIVGCLILTVLLLGTASSAGAQYYDPYNYNQYNYNDPYYYTQNYNCYPNCGYYPTIGQNPTSPNPTTNNAVVNPDSAELFGTVNPNGAQTNVWFDYGPNASFGFQSGYQSAGSGWAPVQVMARVNNLIPNTTYYYRVSAQNQYGLQRGQMQTFITNSSGGIYNPPTGGGYGAPLATTQAATNVGVNSASVHGTIAANGSPTTAWFEYGTSANPANRSETRAVDASQNNFQLNFQMGGLVAGTTYYYRVAAQNSYGVTRGNVMSFRTSGAYTPPASSNPPAGNNPPANTTSTGSNANLMTLTASLDDNRVAPGEETNYVLKYKNPARTSVRDVVLQTTLPAGVEYVIASKLPRIENRTFFFDLATLPANAEGEVSVRIKIAPDAPSNINLHSTLSYKDAQGGTKSASASTGLTVAAETTATNTTANVSDKVNNGWSWWVWFIIFLLGFFLVVGGYIFYRYSRAKQSFTP